MVTIEVLFCHIKNTFMHLVHYIIISDKLVCCFILTGKFTNVTDTCQRGISYMSLPIQFQVWAGVAEGFNHQFLQPMVVQSRSSASSLPRNQRPHRKLPPRNNPLWPVSFNQSTRKGKHLLLTLCWWKWCALTAQPLLPRDIKYASRHLLW